MNVTNAARSLLMATVVALSPVLDLASGSTQAGYGASPLPAESLPEGLEPSGLRLAPEPLPAETVPNDLHPAPHRVAPHRPVPLIAD